MKLYFTFSMYGVTPLARNREMKYSCDAEMNCGISAASTIWFPL